MKLITKYNRTNVVATIVVLLLSGICYYFFIRAVLLHQLDKDLKVEEREIIDYVKENDRLPEPTNYKNEQEEFLPAQNSVQRRFSSVTQFDKGHNEDISYRQIEFPLTAHGMAYRIVVRKSQAETEDLIQLILTITLGMVLLLLFTLFLVNRFLLNKLWKPFNSTLRQMKKFNVTGKETVDLEPTDINEFKELNEAVHMMTGRAVRDYGEIKGFTENASHEIQTPLAIIKSKLELLSQSEILKEEQMNILQSVSEAVNRLSKLNQSLILLTKIDNRQFTETEKVDMSSLVNKQVIHYEELVSAKRILLTKNIEDNIKITMNESLAETLVSNLLTNAIKHNVENGTINISLQPRQLAITNTGLPLDGDPAHLFGRFKKNKVSSESLGLGLSIVKKISERYHFTIQYQYASGIHTTTLDFK